MFSGLLFTVGIIAFLCGLCKVDAYLLRSIEKSQLEIDKLQEEVNKARTYREVE